MPQGSLRCPRCPSSILSDGPFHECRQCKGVWIAEPSIEQHVGKLPAPGSIACEISKTRTGLFCAECGESMQPLDLMQEPVDRCKHHGIWFDQHELRAVVDRVRRAAPAVRHERVVHHPSNASLVADAVTDAYVLDVAIDAAASGIEIVGEVAGSGIGEVILEILGGIFSAIDF
jgi:Zn-finger nucleic acid-binding protein